MVIGEEEREDELKVSEEPTCCCMHVHMCNEPQVQFLLGPNLAFLPCSFKAKVYL